MTSLPPFTLSNTPTRPGDFLKPSQHEFRTGGLVVIETPNIHSVPFRLLKSRWRQFIPEHYFFFDEKTMGKLLEDAVSKWNESRELANSPAPH
jgi:hypothetical protein